MRPQIICHMLAPLDGRLIIPDCLAGTGHTHDEVIQLYNLIHDSLAADAWMIGRSTGEEFSDGIDLPYDDTGTPERPVHIGDPDATSFAILIDKDGRLRWDRNHINGDHLIVVLNTTTPDSHLAGLQERGVSYILSDGPGIDLVTVLDMLGTRFRVRRILLEGGGHTNGEFIKAKLVDQISLILFPAISGKSGTPSIFEGGDHGLADKLRLKMTSFREVGFGSLHVMYDVIQ